MYYLHYVPTKGTLYAVVTKGVKRKGAIVNAGFSEGPFDSVHDANSRAHVMNATVI